VNRYFPTSPVSIPLPDKLILFSPHPDDVAISLGALVAWSAGRISIAVVLMTDGSEAQLPSHLVDPLVGPGAPVEERRRARGRIRLQEAVREAVALGLDPSVVQLLNRQAWFSQHCTPAEYMNADLSLRDVNGFVPAPLDDDARDEMREVIGSGRDTLCAFPDPNDRLAMHRLTSRLVADNLGEAQGMTYECLSTTQVTGPQTIFGFDEDLMQRKCAAILAHQSMLERRKRFGGYSNPGTEFYDEIVRRNNGALARELGLACPYAERLGWWAQ
jgi:LmbE family N-acetylglucosaminyl deacetylase